VKILKLTTSRKPRLGWTSLSDCELSVGLLDRTAPVPDIPGVQFLVTPLSSPQKRILEAWKLADCVSGVDVIQNHIIPAWQGGISDTWSSTCKEQMAAYILGTFSTLSLDSQSALQTIAIVPVSTLDGQSCFKFSKASELVDPNVTELTDLCFDTEEIVPKSSFFREFHVALKGCGIKTSIDEDLVSHRILCYANGQHSPAEVRSRACKLLRASCRWTSVLTEDFRSNLRRLAWLPSTKAGVESLSDASNCRSIKDRLLVSSQLPILSTDISEAWESRLGWGDIIPSSVLLSQLQFGISQKSREIIDAVLFYISDRNLVLQLAADLKGLECAVCNDVFLKPSQAFRPASLMTEGCRGLHPYLANVDYRFWRDHEKLLTLLGVGDKPKPADLLKLQEVLEAKGDLDEHDTSVAIELLRLAINYPRESWSGLKILGASGRFHGVSEIYYNDLPARQSKQDLNLTHPGIPKSTIEHLMIDSVSSQRVKGILEIEDDDEDEFDQQENAITRISDTLERYPIETTFREYLANADDTEGASKISWVLDHRSHSCAELITSQAKELQGPSLLCHNDGIFSESDFHGFKNVGEGSKMQNKGSIGQFGRGSQTMFHFTDYPMILSGNFLLILDPQQEILPMNPLKGRRKPGVKLKLSKIREVCPDQLRPFEGLFGYDMVLDHYPGTIFRFPLVTLHSKGSLRTSKRELNTGEICKLLDTYFNEARTSPLFLRRIISIEFRLYGEADSGWVINCNGPFHRRATNDPRSSQQFICTFAKHNAATRMPYMGEDTWMVSCQDLSQAIQLVPESSRRVAKNVECGMAALTSSTANNDNSGAQGTPVSLRIFNTLPLSIASDLPVHVHASFSLSGDRKSIVLDEYGSKSAGSESNRYLLQEALPKLYLAFLGDLAGLLHQDAYRFWPQEEPPKRSFGSHIFKGFWKELMLSPQKIFPAQSQQPGVQRILRFDQAVFDFMPKESSDLLLPLLLSLGIDVVRDVPRKVSRQLKLITGVKYVTGSMLRAMMKTDTCEGHVLSAIDTKSAVWDALFNALVPINLSKEDAHELDGCVILPLADRNLGLGTLRLLEVGQPATYFLASAEEARLFSFASAKLVVARVKSNIETLFDKAKFNIEPLQLRHVEELLHWRHKSLVPTIVEDQWLAKFWKYWNATRAPGFKYPDVDKFDAQIYRATYNHGNSYLTPREFDELPAVVMPPISPLTLAQRHLCQQIPGLYLVDPQLMPKSVSNKEKNLGSETSFSRLVRSLHTLGQKMGTGHFVARHLDEDSTKVCHWNTQHCEL